jgi:hypothetical protein
MSVVLRSTSGLSEPCDRETQPMVRGFFGFMSVTV